MLDADTLRVLVAFQKAQLRRGLEPSTIASRDKNYRLFAASIRPRTLFDVNRHTIETFLDQRDHGLRGRYKFISDLHVLYRWAERQGFPTTDPTLDIERPRLPRLVPRPISTPDLRRAIDAAPPILAIWMKLAAFEGFRCIEIARLQRDDILEGHDPPIILVRGKGSKERVLPLHPEVQETFRGRRLPHAGPVFRTQAGRPYSARQVSDRSNRYLHDVGIDATMHSLRHWFGSQLYRTTGRDLLLVSDLMGHSSVRTTQGYAAFDRAGAPDAVRRLSTGG